MLNISSLIPSTRPKQNTHIAKMKKGAHALTDRCRGRQNNSTSPEPLPCPSVPSRTTLAHTTATLPAGAPGCSSVPWRGAPTTICVTDLRSSLDKSHHGSATLPCSLCPPLPALPSSPRIVTPAAHRAPTRSRSPPRQCSPRKPVSCQRRLLRAAVNSNIYLSPVCAAS